MDSDLDLLIEDLRRTPLDADLSQVQPGAWRRIDQVRRTRRLETWLVPARAGAVVFALTAGIALGAAHAREPSAAADLSAFEVASGLAPSTLLDER